MATLGERVARLRFALGWSQSDLAKRTGLQTAAISHIETGLRSPMLRTINSVRAAFGVSWSHLMDGTEYDDERK